MLQKKKQTSFPTLIPKIRLHSDAGEKWLSSKKKKKPRERLSPNTNTICLTEPFTLCLAAIGTQRAGRNQPTKPVAQGQSLGQFMKTEAGLPYEESFRGGARVQFL